MAEEERESKGKERLDLVGVSEVLPAHKQDDPIDEFSGWVKHDLRRFMKMMARLVRFVDYWEYPWEDGSTHTLSVERFSQLVNLAILDLFTEAADDEKARHIGFRYRSYHDNPLVLQPLRLHPAYERILADVRTKLIALRDGTNLEVLAPFFENAAAIESAHTMFFGKKDRDKIEAAREFMDRVAPKKSRGEGGGMVFIFPPQQEANLHRTLEIIGQFNERHGEQVISAKRVRVPALPPAE